MERMTYSIAEAAAATGLSRPTLERHLAAGRLASVKIGGRRLIAVADLEAFVRSGEDQKSPKDDPCRSPTPPEKFL
jgi:excisionase family DNA binding protein